jgi:glycosyltransferase involved in cell wall biosynthesis
VIDHPVVSIVTPCRNAAPFIEQCVASVLKQDYPFVEHIVQDGASDDGTVEILRRYGRNERSLQVVSVPDTGQSDGLNRALQRCRGDILGVLNADDEYLPHAASWSVEQFARHPGAAVVYGDKFNIDARGEILSISRGPHPYRFDRLFCVEDVPPAQAAFIRRSAFEQVGFYADSTRKTCPDYEMWVRLGLKFSMQYVPGLVARYREHPGSETSQCSSIDLAVDSRIEVIERTLSDPRVSDGVKALRARALAGTYLWAAVSKLGVCAHNGEVLEYVRRSLLASHNSANCLRVARFLVAFATPRFLRRRLIRSRGVGPLEAG